jgi:hypothetical protein
VVGSPGYKKAANGVGRLMSSSLFLNDPGHWRGRATEMRALAAQAKDAEAQAIMMRLASDYDKLAARAEKRADGQRPEAA